MGEGRYFRWFLVVCLFVFECRGLAVAQHASCDQQVNARLSIAVRLALSVEETLGSFGVSSSFIKDFWSLVEEVRGATGQRVVVLEVIDAPRGLVVHSQICSFRQRGVSFGNLIFLALDARSFQVMKSLNVTTVLFRSTRAQDVVSKYLMKFVGVYLVSSLGMETWLVDPDVILLGNLESIWFGGEWDFEFGSDAVILRRDDFSPKIHDVNTGFVRVRPTEAARLFALEVMRYFLEKRRVDDQTITNELLRNSTSVLGGWCLGRLGLKWCVLEPIKVANGGLLFCAGRESLAEWARSHKIDSPAVVHLNWHAPSAAKARTVRILGWSSRRGCVNIEWKFWVDPAMQQELQCSGRLVRAVDRGVSSL